MNRRDFNSTISKLAGTSLLVLANAPAVVTAETSRGRTQTTHSSNPPAPGLENRYRGYIVDHHSPDPPASAFANFDPEQWLRVYDMATGDQN